MSERRERERSESRLMSERRGVRMLIFKMWHSVEPGSWANFNVVDSSLAAGRARIVIPGVTRANFNVVDASLAAGGARIIIPGMTRANFNVVDSSLAAGGARIVKPGTTRANFNVIDSSVAAGRARIVKPGGRRARRARRKARVVEILRRNISLWEIFSCWSTPRIATFCWGESFLV